MKKLTKSILAVVLTSSFVVSKAQEKKKEADEKEIEGVVVTAMGVSKTQKAVSYSVTSVKPEALEGRPVADPFKSLQGNVSGLILNSVGGAV